jgi:Flp pilus assembly protein protease CpaA
MIFFCFSTCQDEKLCYNYLTSKGRKSSKAFRGTGSVPVFREFKLHKSKGDGELAVLCVSLGVVCVFDYVTGRIPNLLLAAIFAVGAGWGVYQRGLPGLGIYLVVTVAVVFLLFPLFRIGGLGAGDVKLLAVCAGYFPVHKIFYFLFCSMLVSAIFSIVRLMRERNVRERIAYFCEYCLAVALSGRWQLYLPGKDERKFSGICMSGPVLCSVLLGLGGVY